MTDAANEIDNTNMDDLLTGAHIDVQNQSHEDDTPDDSPAEDESEDLYGNDEPDDRGESDEPEADTDDYGNEKAAPKTYTEDEVNERINQAVRERLARAERNAQTETKQQPATQDGFEYDANSKDSWQVQLESFVKQTVGKMHQEQATQAQQAKEQKIQAEFEAKFQKGMSRFKDFTEVMSRQNITDAMVIATRGMDDPAAFMYAAVNRSPEEIKRIASIADPYAQMVEMGKLEERMRKTKSTTKAPRPLSRTREDSSIAHKSDREPSIEDLIAQSDRKRTNLMKMNRRR